MFYLLIISTSFSLISCLLCLLNQDNGGTIPPMGYLWKEWIVHLYTQLILLLFGLICTRIKWLSCVRRGTAAKQLEMQHYQRLEVRMKALNCCCISCTYHLWNKLPSGWPPSLEIITFEVKHNTPFWNLPSSFLSYFRTNISHIHTTNGTVGLPLSTLLAPTQYNNQPGQASNSSH